MRAHILSRRARSLVKTQPIRHRALLSSTHALRYPRKDHSGSSQATPRISRRSSSSITPPPTEPDEAVSPSASPSASEPPPEDANDKPKRRTRVSTASKDTDASPSLPTGLDILWIPEDDPDSPHSHALPPPEIFEEILHNLHITLHPQTQHKAAYASASGSLIEPTFAMYCPIEGGDIYVDETVRELARQTGAEVVVLDAAQLAAGACGQFGKAASVLQLPNNPLHVSANTSLSSRNNARLPSYDEDDWDDSPVIMPSRMTLQVFSPVPTRHARTVLASPPRAGSMSKLKAFFDEIINITAESSVPESSPVPSSRRKPRIVYVRDFGTLAPSSATWYPALLAAVRQRRQGAISRPTSPVVNPTTIIFGITPSVITPGSTPSSDPNHQGFVNLAIPRSASAPVNIPSKLPKSEYSEDPSSDKAREKRLMSRLKQWSQGDAASHDIPQLANTDDYDDASSSKGAPEIVLVGGSEGIGGLPSMLSSALSTAASSRGRSGPSGSGNNRQFFRTSLVIPNVRTPSLERSTRMARRREINELIMRMAVAAVGGELGKMEPITTSDISEIETEQTDLVKKEKRLWEDWGKAVEPWSTVRRIADRAVGKTMASTQTQSLLNRSLDATPIVWSSIYEAWSTDRTAQDLWKSMLLESSSKPHREHVVGEEGKNSEEEDEPSIDELIERIKRDPELDHHEARLLGSIVDTKSLSTTFGQVHLPEHTIDSVRTIVSLPLLHPGAFDHGLLKEHAMTGCLLFGPPGTGKTLVVRAIAKEAGCRMLAIMPSDVMDMYVGEGEKLVRAVFSLARRLSPCVVFIDELDALFGARMSRETGGAIAHRGVITEFMQEMDGLKSSKNNVIVIGATNRPFDLDDAVLRRLPRRLLVDLPGEREREEILKILLRDETLSSDIDLKVLAKRAESFSGSDLKHLCVAAVLDAVKERVEVPWRSMPLTVLPDQNSPTASVPDDKSVEDSSSENVAAAGDSQVLTIKPEPTTPSYSRTVAWRNFEKALKEITPSASESLGSLADLRKWNEEFGEGRKQRRQLMWGKGRFGFTIQPPDNQDAGRVAAPTTSYDSSIDTVD
ncbi:uncharacterized protein FIBRA_04447 [Fibroporia radiculosa]|uniref:AAA+ ATPase domain-containing protein n=1 Tax=Fibroporia radiculosa TaxID=599839 RepID=J4HWJ1_9APHY|nr:uncharacterized protein FIBRA_04447 [Fibroporia radiculosa]CCM02352.1 predicted protein [Fibroporia radiculosa]